MINRIKILLDQIDRLDDILEQRKNKLESIIQPIFRAASGFERAYVEEVHIYKDTISVGYKHYWDDYVEHFKIPKSIFEAEDPIAAATSWREQATAEKKAKQKAAHKKDLLNQLARLEVEDELE